MTADRTARERFAAIAAMCPDGHEVELHFLSAVDQFEPGDVVISYRPDNGHRGRLRLRAAVTVARYAKKAERAS